MSHISDFKKFKLMLENNNINYIDSTRVFESSDLPAVNSTAPGAEIEDLPLDGSGNRFNSDTEPNLFTTSRTVFGKTAMPGLRVDGLSIDTDDEIASMLRLFLRGVRQITGTDKIGGSEGGDIDDDKAEEIVNSLKIKSTKVGTVKTIMEVEKGGAQLVQSVGTVKDDYIARAGEKDRRSNFIRIASYLNTFNLYNWAAGDFTQYDPNKMLNDMNRVDLTKDSKAIMNDADSFLYMITPGEFVQTKGEREDVDVVVQGQSAQEGAAENAFGEMKFESKPTDKAVIAIGNKILEFLGDKKTIKKITLTSSASPVWKGKKTALSNGTGDPSGGKLKSNTFSGEASELGNQYLAWLRGDSFKRALQQYLGAAYPEQGSDTVINWKVSSDEPGAGKHFKYRVETAAEAPTTIKKTEFYQGESGVKKGTGEYVIYKISYDRSALGTESKGVLGFGKKVSYGALKVGDKIKIKYKSGNKAKDPYTITKIEDNNVYIDVDGEDRLIPEERYVSRTSTTEKGEEI